VTASITYWLNFPRPTRCWTAAVRSAGIDTLTLRAGPAYFDKGARGSRISAVDWVEREGGAEATLDSPSQVLHIRRTARNQLQPLVEPQPSQT
jgi:hypothetical protein